MFILIDNYDSFTYNLLHYLQMAGAEVEVLRNDAISADALIARAPQGVVISPGPGTPDDAGITLDYLANVKGRIPTFGVCLGHQSIGQCFGGAVIRHEPMHGKVSPITHDGSGVFAGLPSPINVTRYHSLIVERTSLPDCLRITAETDDGIIMGLEHTKYPLHGVQFHPESIASEQGHEMVANFVRLAKAYQPKEVAA